MIPSDPFDSLAPHSVILDNTTLFACQPLRIRGEENHWTGSSWSQTIVKWGMSNLVEALVLYDTVYVDGHADFQCPIAEQIAEQFDGAVRAVEVGEVRTAIFSDLCAILDSNAELAWGLYILATKVHHQELHLSHIWDKLQDEIPRTVTGEVFRAEYLPKQTNFEPLIFRTYYYSVLSALSNTPYVPFPVRNPLLFALASTDLVALLNGPERNQTYERYTSIAHRILESFDKFVRKAVSDRLLSSPLGLPPLPMPSLWEMVEERADRKKANLCKDIRKLRDQARPYREFVGRIVDAYNKGDIVLIEKERRSLEDAQQRWSDDLNLPRVTWKKVVLPIKVKLPFLEVGNLEIPLKYPVRNPYRKPHLAFLHHWVERNF
jgi:hypothetical protein